MDRDLVERAQRGDRDAYEALAAASVRRLYLTAQRILRDADRADDATQQVLVAIWEELPSLRDVDKFDAWTYRLLVRTCLAEARRTRRTGVTIVPLETSASPSTADAASLVALRDELDRALRSLSIDHRVVVVLHHYAGLPLGEIAEILGIPYGTVGSRLHHAMRALRAVLDADAATVAGGQTA